MATKIKTSKSKGPIEYPPDHKPGMKVPKGGSSCSVCEYESDGKCSNEYFQKWMGSDIIPGPTDSYCSDWFHER